MKIENENRTKYECNPDPAGDPAPGRYLRSHRRLTPIPPAFTGAAETAQSKDPDGQTAESNPKKALSNAYNQPYDPYSHRLTDNPTSFWGTVFHLMILIGGPGILSIPSAFVSAGYLIGIILVPCLFGLYIHMAHLFVWSEYTLCKLKRVPTLSYADVAYHAFKEGPPCSQWFAKWSRVLTHADFIFVWFGYYCYNYVLVCQNLQLLFRYTLHQYIPLNLLLVFVLAPSVLMACIPKLKYLVPVSLVGSLLNGISLVLILYFIFTDPSPWRIPPLIGQISKVPLLIGSVIVNLNVAGIIIPLKNEMKEPRRFSSPLGVLTVSYLPVSFMYIGFSVLSSLKYGDAIEPSIIENLPQHNPLAQIGVALSSLAIICQQPLVMYVPFDVVWNQILKKKICTFHPVMWECALRVALVFLALILSVAVPNAFLFISLSGTVGTSIDSFILPALVHTVILAKHCQSRLKYWLVLLKNFTIIYLASILVIRGSIDSIKQIKDFYSS